MRNYLLFILITLCLVQCVPQKDMIYLQDSDVVKDSVSYSNSKGLNKIRVFDQLYVQVSSFDNGNLNFMSNDANRYGGGRSEADLSMVAYTVEEDGSIKLPILGKTNVLGKTTDEAAEQIRNELESYLNTPSVKVSFVNKSVTVLGSVNNPGRYFYASEYINVFQALGLAGDISEYGNRNEVVVVREQNNIITKQRINLTRADLLGQPQLYIQPNDVIYVEPLKRRYWGFQSFPWALVLSSITTFVLVANYVK